MVIDYQYITYYTILPGGAQTEFRNELRFLLYQVHLCDISVRFSPKITIFEKYIR